MRDVKIAEIPDLEVDPVTLDIIESALKNYRHEMDAVLYRTAMSPVIREQHDEFPMICDPNGRMVVGQFGSYIREMMDSFDRPIYPGDVILLNDPYLCGGAISHINDFLILVPVFDGDELIGWTSMFGHQMDVGGPLPGSFPTNATSIFGEGLRIPPVKLFEQGELNEDILNLILNNVRIPVMNRSDLMGIVAGCKTAEQRIKELCERFGRDTYLAACQALLDRTRRAMQTLIERNISTEPQSFEDYVDDDGLGNGPFKMKLTIWREGDRAVFDWTGTDPQAAGPINFYLNEGMFKMFIGVYLIMVYDPQILFNDGFYDLIESPTARRLPAAPQVPGAARLPHPCPGPAVRCHGRLPGAEEPRADHGRRLRHQPPPAVQRHRQKRGVFLHLWRSATAAFRADRRATASTATRGGRCSPISRPSIWRATARCGWIATPR